MTKEQFIKAMEKLLELKKAEEEINKALKKLDPSFNYFSLGEWETLFVNTLMIACNDKDKWIEFWLYECKCGKDKRTKAWRPNGKSIPLKTIDDLWKAIN